MARNSYPYLPHFIVLLLVVAFRLPSLIQHSLWADELAVWHEINVPTFMEMVKYHLATDFNPIGFPVLQYFFAKLFNDPLYALRGFSLLGSVFSTLAAMALAEKLALSRGAKLLLAISLVLNYRLIYFAQEARAYIWMVGFCLTTLIFYLQLLTSLSFNKSFTQEFRTLLRHKNFYSFFISLLILAYLHFFGAFAMACFLVHFLFYAGKKRNGFLFFLVFALIAFVFYLPQFYVALNTVRTVDKLWIHPVEITDLFNYFRWYFGRASLTSILCLGTVVVSGWFFGLWQKRALVLSVLLAILLGTYAIGYVISLIYIPIMYDRYMLIGLLPFLFIFILAWDVIYAGLQAPYRKAFLLVFSLYFTAQSLHSLLGKENYYGVAKNTQLREAAEFVIHENNREATVVLSNGSPLTDQFYFDYFKVPEVKLTYAPLTGLEADDLRFKAAIRDRQPHYFFWDHGKSNVNRQIPDFLRIEKEINLVGLRVLKLAPK